MCKSVLVLALLLLGMKGLGAFSLNDCVCNADESVCGLVVTILDESVIIFSENERTMMSNNVANQANASLCGNAICGGNCLCAASDTTFYVFEANLVPGRAIAAGTCYRAFGFPVQAPPSSSVEILDVVTDPMPDPPVYALMDRESSYLDPTGATCGDPADCLINPPQEPDSPICNAVFPGSATITKGKYNDRCYYGVHLSCKYQEARDFCETVGLNLVWVEVEVEGQIVSQLTGLDEFWIGLERPLFSRDDWIWVSAGTSVNADNLVAGRFEGPRLTRFFNRAVVKKNDAGEYPLRPSFRWVKKNFVCEEAVRCSGAKVSATISLAIVVAYIAGKLM